MTISRRMMQDSARSWRAGACSRFHAWNDDGQSTASSKLPLAMV